MEGCRGAEGNGCPSGEVCSSTNSTAGTCEPESENDPSGIFAEGNGFCAARPTPAGSTRAAPPRSCPCSPPSPASPCAGAARPLTARQREAHGSRPPRPPGGAATSPRRPRAPSSPRAPPKAPRSHPLPYLRSSSISAAAGGINVSFLSTPVAVLRSVPRQGERTMEMLLASERRATRRAAIVECQAVRAGLVARGPGNRSVDRRHARADEHRRAHGRAGDRFVQDPGHERLDRRDGDHRAHPPRPAPGRPGARRGPALRPARRASIRACARRSSASRRRTLPRAARGLRGDGRDDRAEADPRCFRRREELDVGDRELGLEAESRTANTTRLPRRRAACAAGSTRAPSRRARGGRLPRGRRAEMSCPSRCSTSRAEARAAHERARGGQALTPRPRSADRRRHRRLRDARKRSLPSASRADPRNRRAPGMPCCCAACSIRLPTS